MYQEAFTGAFAVVALLLGVVFGGWLLGTEYRQGTVKRMLTTESRRGRVLTAKAGVGRAAMAAVLTTTALVGWGAARLVASVNNVTVIFNGRELLLAGLFAIATAAVAFALSAITRSDSAAMLGTVGLVVVLDPLITLIPKVGQYSLVSVLETVLNRVVGVDTSGDLLDAAGASTTAAAIALVIWFGSLGGAAWYLFVNRDV